MLKVLLSKDIVHEVGEDTRDDDVGSPILGRYLLAVPPRYLWFVSVAMMFTMIVVGLIVFGTEVWTIPTLPDNTIFFAIRTDPTKVRE